MQLNRSPTDEEVDAEVAKERSRLSEEKRKGPADYGRAIEEVRSRVGELEGSFSSLREHVTASTKRVEDMLKAALEKWGSKEGTALHENMEPSSSTQVVGTSGPTSHSQEVRQVAQKDLIMPMVKAVDPSIEAELTIAARDINNDEVVTRDVEKDKEVIKLDVTGNADTGVDADASPSEEVPEDVDRGGCDSQEERVYSRVQKAGLKPAREDAEAVAEGLPVASNPVRQSTLLRGLHFVFVASEPL